MENFPNDRCVEIISILINEEKPITINKIANKLNVSSKTIRNDLNKLNDKFIDNKDIKIEKKPRVGVWLNASLKGRDALINKINKNKVYNKPYSQDKRHIYIIKRLLQSNKSLTMKNIADELFVSRVTIHKDLEEVERWLSKYNLTLKRKQNYGIEVLGDEKNWRKAAADLLVILKNDEELKDMLSESEDIDPTIRIDYENFIQMKELFPDVDLRKIETILIEAEKNLDFLLADEAFQGLLVHIAISMKRLKQNKDISMDENQLLAIKDKNEYKVAKWLAEKIEEKFNITIPESEVGYITLHVLGAKVQEDLHMKETKDILDNIDSKLLELAKEIIALIENILSVDFSEDEKLLTGLVLHLRPAINRLKYGLTLRNPLLEDIKMKFPSVFGAAWASSVLFEKYYGVKVQEEEIGYISIHIGAALERLNNKTRAVIVCSSGIGTAQLVAVRLEREVNELEIVHTTSVHDIKNMNTLDFDIVISTIPLNFKSKPTIKINPLVTERDVKKVKKYIKNVEETRNFNKIELEDKKSQLFKEDLIFKNLKIESVEEVIKKLGNKLVSKGYVDKDFIKSALDRENITSTAVGKGVAIPHGTEKLVNKSTIAVAILNKPINWSGNKVDIVFLLALNFETGDSIRKFFRGFYSMLDNEKTLNNLRNNNKKRDLLNILTRKDEK
ncbi:MAG: BglG family transcription antiterminator [Firmicutes bacterium]|nr:BglG family transcription antiterminator [Bacillota bacterium]